MTATRYPAGMTPWKHHIVKPGSRVQLADIDPSHTPALSGPARQERAAAEALHAQNLAAMQDLQYRLWAEGGRSMLVVLQGMDTAGKDGTIRHVFGALTPQGVRVVGFKQPTLNELAHDYLWRIHRETPAKGRIVVFNRSHYEDVLIVRVHGLAPEQVWRQRYDQINHFEELLAANGTVILKIFLHISKGEQRKRLQSRLDDPEKRWKFAAADIHERKHWADYHAAYEDALSRCSTDHAPWFVIPANRKWYRNWAISSIVREALEGMDPRPPEANFDPDAIKID